MAASSNGTQHITSGSRPDTVQVPKRTWNLILTVVGAALLALGGTVWRYAITIEHHSIAIADIRKDDERLDEETNERFLTMRGEVKEISDRQYKEHMQMRADIGENKAHIIRHEAACAERHAREDHR